MIVIIFDLLRVRNHISFPCDDLLRHYENNRLGSYVYFGIGAMILFLFFPEQISIPCILCASITDPFMGEIRHHYSKKSALLGGFLISFLFFAIIWMHTPINIMIPIASIGSISAVIAEKYAGFWIDDDFLMQMLPAMILLCITTLFALNQMYLSTPPLNPLIS